MAIKTLPYGSVESHHYDTYQATKPRVRGTTKLGPQGRAAMHDRIARSYQVSHAVAQRQAPLVLGLTKDEPRTEQVAQYVQVAPGRWKRVTP